MKAKKGYKNLKGKFSTGKWLKRYFSKRTSRRRHYTEETWQQSETVQSVPTNRMTGEVKLHIAPREIPETKYRDSTE